MKPNPNYNKVTETMRNYKLKNLLQQCDLWLAHLEGYARGQARDDITKLRAEIKTELRKSKETFASPGNTRIIVEQ